MSRRSSAGSGDPLLGRLIHFDPTLDGYGDYGGSPDPPADTGPPPAADPVAGPAIPDVGQNDPAAAFGPPQPSAPPGFDPRLLEGIYQQQQQMAAELAAMRAQPAQQGGPEWDPYDPEQVIRAVDERLTPVLGPALQRLEELHQDELVSRGQREFDRAYQASIAQLPPETDPWVREQIDPEMVKQHAVPFLAATDQSGRPLYNGAEVISYAIRHEAARLAAAGQKAVDAYKESLRQAHGAGREPGAHGQPGLQASPDGRTSGPADPYMEAGERWLAGLSPVTS